MHFPGADKSGKGRTKIGKATRGSRRINPVLREAMAGEEEVYTDHFVSGCRCDCVCCSYYFVGF